MRRSTRVISLAATIACAASSAFASCNSLDAYHQQDFVLGRWDIYEDGQKTAEANLVKDLSGCAIRLTWTSSDTSEPNGLGLFTYSQAQKRWTYLWATDSGETSYSTGALSRPGDMRFTTQRLLPGGGKKLRKWGLSLQTDGAIRELSRASAAGTGWQVEFDLLWKPHKE